MAYRSKRTGRFVKGHRAHSRGRHRKNAGKRRLPTALEKSRAMYRRRRAPATVFSRGRQHRPRVTITGSGHTFTKRPRSPYRQPGHAIYHINPYMLKEVGAMLGNPHRRGHKRGRSHGRRHARNPMGGGIMSGVTSTFRHPVDTLMDGTLGLLSAYFTVSVPNAFLPFTGSDMMSRLLRLGSRLVTGGVLTALGGSFLRNRAHAIGTGAMIGAVGGSVLDFVGGTVVLGRGDIAQMPGSLLASVTGSLGTGAYIPRVIGTRAYTRPQLAAAQRNLGVSGPKLTPMSISRHNLGWG